MTASDHMLCVMLLLLIMHGHLSYKLGVSDGYRFGKGMGGTDKVRKILRGYGELEEDDDG